MEFVPNASAHYATICEAWREFFRILPVGSYRKMRGAQFRCGEGISGAEYQKDEGAVETSMERRVRVGKVSYLYGFYKKVRQCRYHIGVEITNEITKGELMLNFRGLLQKYLIHDLYPTQCLHRQLARVSTRTPTPNSLNASRFN